MTQMYAHVDFGTHTVLYTFDTLNILARSIYHIVSRKVCPKFACYSSTRIVVIIWIRKELIEVIVNLWNGNLKYI